MFVAYQAVCAVTALIRLDSARQLCYRFTRDAYPVGACPAARHWRTAGAFRVTGSAIALGDGGKVQMPLAKTFFASSFGLVADRFGVSWMVIAEP